MSVVNKVVDYSKLQGMTNPADSYIQPFRDLNHRYVTIENSGEDPVGIAIMLYPMKSGGPLPKIQFIADGVHSPSKGIVHLGVNTVDEPTQYIHILNPLTGAEMGFGTVLRTDSNQFVVRQGVNIAWIDTFRRSRYFNAQH